MLHVRDIMTLDVVTVSAGASLREVAETLVSDGVSGVPVVSGEEVVGVVSATDLAGFAADAPGAPTERDFPDEPGFSSEEEDGTEEMPDDPASAYFLAFWSDAGADVVERVATPATPEWNVFEEHTVEEVMTTALSSVSPDDTVREAARYMLRNGVHRVLVMDDGELVGVLSTTDFVKAVSQYGISG